MSLCALGRGRAARFSVPASVAGLLLVATGLVLVTYSTNSLSYNVLLDLPSLGNDASAINDLDSV